LSLVARERETYEAMWLVEDYAKTSPGGQLVPAFMEMSGAKPTAYASDSLLENLRAKGMGGLLRPYQQTVLDAGCGSGKGAVALQQAGFRVEMCDLTTAGLIEDAINIPFHEACLWDPLKPQVGRTYDWVYCCDVLEHIPTPFVMLAVSRLLEVAHKGVFLSIALQGDNFGIWVGKPLHQTVMGFVQWRDVLSELGHVKECRDMLMNGIYLMEPK
jgi:SAM-dependent methyltransferase